MTNHAISAITARPATVIPAASPPVAAAPSPSLFVFAPSAANCVETGCPVEGRVIVSIEEVVGTNADVDASVGLVDSGDTDVDAGCASK
ncbi:hypothetical protein AA0115_g2629 [Alternaria tenuissima]|jgi:hypothetical protein|uniref:Uncharacterized protein n=1 Tax=Alternaria tenuissima TaxID=119927 RepID=A0AB37WUY9_9PLEO|nr:hypothetical protein AA0115_g2629 [Alternaria tenuissima]